jgi:hypothetical protein
MRISPQQLTKDAEASGYRPEILEKVFHLLNLLSGFQAIRSSGADWYSKAARR